MDWSQGCVRNKPLSCHKDGFVKFNELKLPDTTNSWVNKSMSLKECRDKCLNNCSCMAYTNSDIRGEGSGCALWFGDLVDIRQFPAGGQELYIRMSASEIGVGLILFIGKSLLNLNYCFHCVLHSVSFYFFRNCSASLAFQYLLAVV